MPNRAAAVGRLITGAMNTASPREEREKHPQHLANNENPHQHSTGPCEQSQRRNPIGDPRQIWKYQQRESEERQQRVSCGFPERPAGADHRSHAGCDQQASATNPISSASDGSIATRTGAAVVPATSNDARLNQSATPAIVAAPIGPGIEKGSLFHRTHRKPTYRLCRPRRDNARALGDAQA